MSDNSFLKKISHSPVRWGVVLLATTTGGCALQNRALTQDQLEEQVVIQNQQIEIYGANSVVGEIVQDLSDGSIPIPKNTTKEEVLSILTTGLNLIPVPEDIASFKNAMLNGLEEAAETKNPPACRFNESSISLLKHTYSDTTFGSVAELTTELKDLFDGESIDLYSDAKNTITGDNIPVYSSQMTSEEGLKMHLGKTFNMEEELVPEEAEYNYLQDISEQQLAIIDTVVAMNSACATR